MNSDEFAFLNRQLAAMLREGIPLEGALRQLCRKLEASGLRRELTALEADLARGEPLGSAIQRRALPELYRDLVGLGAAGQNLPGVLNLLADYYQRTHDLWTRLRGLLVYPILVLIVALAVSGLFLWVYEHIVGAIQTEILAWSDAASPLDAAVCLWLPPIWLGLALIALVVSLAVGPIRRRLAWRLPGFKESQLAQFALALRMLLETGQPLDDALALLERVERDSDAGSDLRQWRARLAQGAGQFGAFADGSRAFPPLFRWLVEQGGQDLIGGLGKAAELYAQRARHKVELVLYAALPVTVVAIGFLIALQMAVLMQPVTRFLNALGG